MSNVLISANFCCLKLTNSSLDKLSVDIHYNNEEYLNFNRNIMQAIVNNYEFLKAFTYFDLFFKKLHDDNDSNKIDEEIISKYGETSDLLRKEFISKKSEMFFEEFFEKNSLSSKQLKIVLDYYKEKYCSEFFINVSGFKNQVKSGLEDTCEEKNNKDVRTK